MRASRMRGELNRRRYATVAAIGFEARMDYGASRRLKSSVSNIPKSRLSR